MTITMSEEKIQRGAALIVLSSINDAGMLIQDWAEDVTRKLQAMWQDTAVYALTVEDFKTIAAAAAAPDDDARIKRAADMIYDELSSGSPITREETDRLARAILSDKPLGAA